MLLQWLENTPLGPWVGPLVGGFFCHKTMWQLIVAIVQILGVYGTLYGAIPFGCALSSAVEHYLHTVGVVGSNPTVRTIFLRAYDRKVSLGFISHLLSSNSHYVG